MGTKTSPTMTLNVRRDFARAPGPRYRSEGSFSGEEFREGYLLPRLKEAMAGDCVLLIDIDGVAGFGVSFLEEAFGGLIREDGLTQSTILQHIELKSERLDYLEEEILSYVKDAQGEKNKSS